MPAIDLDFVRSQFPAFSDPSLEGFAFFENAGGSYACRQVIDGLNRYYTQSKVQPYYGYEPSLSAGRDMDRAKQRLAAWLGVDDDEVNIGPSTSQNTFNLAQALRQHLQAGDEVVVTNQDHEANIGAWRRLEAAGVVIREWRINPATAELETAGLESLLNEKTRAVAFTHASNIVGSINPVREWCALVRAAGALSIVDGVSYAPHGLPDVDELGADIYLFSLYKVYGPHQGVMVMRRSVNESLPNQGHFFNEDLADARFTPAGPDHAQVAAVNGVMDYFDTVKAHHFGQDGNAAGASAQVRGLFRRAEQERVQPVLELLADRPGVRLIGRGRAEGRAPTVSFTREGQSPEQIVASLAAHRIGISNGHCYAYRLIEALGISVNEGVARVSMVHYTSPGEVARLIEALDQVL